MQRVDTQHPLLHIFQSIRRIHLTASDIQRNARARHQVTVNALPSRMQLRVRPAKPLTIPKVHPRLIPDLHIHPQVLEQPLRRTNYRVFRLVGQVLVKVKNVVILHALSRRQIRLMVPHGLEQTARREHALLHTKIRQARGELRIDRVGHGQFEQGVDRQCHVQSSIIWRNNTTPTCHCCRRGLFTPKRIRSLTKSPRALRTTRREAEQMKPT